MNENLPPILSRLEDLMLFHRRSDEAAKLAAQRFNDAVEDRLTTTHTSLIVGEDGPVGPKDIGIALSNLRDRQRNPLRALMLAQLIASAIELCVEIETDDRLHPETKEIIVNRLLAYGGYRGWNRPLPAVVPNPDA